MMWDEVKASAEDRWLASKCANSFESFLGLCWAWASLWFLNSHWLLLKPFVSVGCYRNCGKQDKKRSNYKIKSNTN